MARQFLMSWEGEPAFRWVKMYKGTRYKVSCDELKAPRTKEGSYVAANKWWEAQSPKVWKRSEAVVDAMIDNGALTGEETSSEATDKLRLLVAQAATRGEHLPDWLTVAVLGEEKVKCLKEKLEEDKPVDPAKNLQHWVDKFLAIKRGEIKPLSYREIRYYLLALAKKLGKEMDVTTVNEGTVETEYLYLKNAELSAGARKKRIGFFKNFVEYLAQSRQITMPLNLKRCKFKVRPQKVKTYDTALVKKVLKSLTVRQKCYAMLSLNTGMTSADIGQLTHDMIKGPQLTRKRVKTEDQPNVPIVVYTLWPEVVALLEECKSDDPTLVLTSKRGTPLWVAKQKGETTTYQDLIHQQWDRADLEIPIKAFRSIGATLLKSHKDYSRCVTLYLGHSPSTVEDKHYAAYAEEIFNEALAWLREQAIG